MRELWARRITLLSGLLILLLSAGFAIIQNPTSPSDKAEQSVSEETVALIALDPQRVEAGQQVYRLQSCSRCHAIAGKGNSRNPLDGIGARRDAQQLRDWIIGADALQGELPERAFNIKQSYKELLADDLDTLVIYMQSLRPQQDQQKDQSEPVSEASATAAPTGEDSQCLTCHTNAGHLMQVVKPPPALSEDGCAAAPSRPAFLNAFVNSKFPDSLHGKFGCTGCHGGDASTQDKVAAHTDMKDAQAGCADCHREQAELHETSLHGTLNGMSHALKLRSGADNFHKLETVWNNDCASCHASCSDCHVTLPDAVGGGLIKGHEFFKRPPMNETCVLCHGSRAGAEYTGKWDGLEPDVHFAAGMHCLDCHKNDLHGDGQTYTDRWQVSGRSQCTDCHAALPNKTAQAHDIKHQQVSCQVCHAQPYQNCFSCHGSMEDGEYARRTGHKGLDFKIGSNTADGYPYDIVTLRNNPVARNSFDHFGENILPHFDDYPTWKTVAPHNILRVTQQNRSCDSCHGQDELFLQPGDLDPEGSEANKTVIIAPARELGQQE